MEAALREIRLALLEADVNFKVVKQLIENIKLKAMGEEVLTALSPSQQVIKIVHEELIKILGSHESKLRFANEPPSVFLIVGLQGSGKTTSTGKLARWLSRNGHRPAWWFRWTCTARRRGSSSKSSAREVGQPIYEGAPDESAAAGAGAFGAPREQQTGPRRAAGGYRRPAAHRRAAHDRAAAAEGAAQSGRDPVRGRRHDRAGRRQIGRRISQAPGHHRGDSHQDGWRCPRRRGAFHPPRHRPAAEVRGRGRAAWTRWSRSIPTAPPTASWAWATSFR